MNRSIKYIKQNCVRWNKKEGGWNDEDGCLDKYVDSIFPYYQDLIICCPCKDEKWLKKWKKTTR